MTTITYGNWIVDLDTMTCRNTVNNMIVVFEKKGTFPLGKIQDMPLDLLSRWAGTPYGERKMVKMMMEAHEVFWRAFFERDFENKPGTLKRAEGYIRG